ncbi:MAG: cytochrome c biogenesis protein CcdA [Pseudomonadota bacterium]
MKKIFLFFIASLYLFHAFAEEDLSKLNPLTARGFFTNEEITPGELSDLQIEVQLQEGFSAYHDRFRLKAPAHEGTTVGELFIDPIVEFEDKISKKKKKGVQSQATIKTQVQIPNNFDESQKQFKFVLTYIACTDKFCLTPRDAEFTVPVQVKMPPQKEGSEDLGSSEFIQKQIDNNLAYALLLIFFFGLLTSLTPCVYPLIPITLAVLGTDEKRSQSQSFFISVSYVLGIGITYAILGVIAAQTGQLFGSLISHPIVVILMSVIFFAMGLSLLGFFEIQAPAFIRDRMANSKTEKGLGGAFVSGLLAGVIASPCVGPVLVGVLAYIARTQNSFLGFILLFTFAMGFGMLFILLGTFSQLANKLPRSGAWMNGIKTILALALFGLSFWYAYPVLIKPYMMPAKLVKSHGVQWEKYSKEKIAQAKAEGQPVVIDFFADWCAACVELDELTFIKEPIIAKSQSFMMLKVDATAPTDEVQELSKQYKVYGLPTIIFIAPSGEVQEDLTLTGFEEAEDFIKRMNKVEKR